MKAQKIDDNLLKVLLITGLIAVAVIIRLMPLPQNFAPIGAIALFGGAFLPMRWALSLPLFAMVLSDMLIGMHSLIWATWGSFLLIAFMANKLSSEIHAKSVASMSLGASILFFLITNFAVWAEGRLYPLTIEGLGSSYVNAIPFFRNTLLSDLFFSALLFGSYALLYKYMLNRTGSLRLATS